MKQHATCVTMLLAAVCGGAIQRVGASYSDCLSASDGAWDTTATRGVLAWPAPVAGPDRRAARMAIPGVSHCSCTLTVPDVCGRCVTLGISYTGPGDGLRGSLGGLWHDGRPTGRADEIRRIPFEVFCTPLFADGDNVFSPWDSNCGRIRLDCFHFEIEPCPAFVTTNGPAWLSDRYGSDRAAISDATAMVFSSPGAVLLSGLGVVLIGQQRRRTLL